MLLEIWIFWQNFTSFRHYSEQYKQSLNSRHSPLDVSECTYYTWSSSPPPPLPWTLLSHLASTLDLWLGQTLGQRPGFLISFNSTTETGLLTWVANMGMGTVLKCGLDTLTHSVLTAKQFLFHCSQIVRNRNLRSPNSNFAWPVPR